MSETNCAPTQAAIASVRQMPGWPSSFIGSSGMRARRSCRRSSSTRLSARDAGQHRRQRQTGRVEALRPLQRQQHRRDEAGEQHQAEEVEMQPPRTGAAGARPRQAQRQRQRQQPQRQVDQEHRCQPKCWVSQPPATGPKVEEHTNTDAR